MALTELQIQNRRKYIGGSDARTVLEGTAEDWKALRAEKVDDVRPVFKDAQLLLMDMGTAIEPLILREFHRKIPLGPLGQMEHVVWKDDPFLAFTPDGVTAEKREIVQCKFHTGDQDILALCQTYKAQLTHEMLCSNSTRMWLAVIFGHYGRFAHCEVRRDEALVEQYLMKAMEFKQYIVTGVLPDTMVEGEIVDLKIERRRDHLWPPGDNQVAPLCANIMDNQVQALLYMSAVEDMKAIIKAKEYRDCGSLTWRNEEGFGVTFKVNTRGAVSHHLAFPPRPKKRGRKAA
jgi:hypothetical protein